MKPNNAIAARMIFPPVTCTPHAAPAMAKRLRPAASRGMSGPRPDAGRGLLRPSCLNGRRPVIHVVLLLVCAVVIYLACEWFVNAVEWLGVRMKVESPCPT